MTCEADQCVLPSQNDAFCSITAKVNVQNSKSCEVPSRIIDVRQLERQFAGGQSSKPNRPNRRTAERHAVVPEVTCTRIRVACEIKRIVWNLGLALAALDPIVTPESRELEVQAARRAVLCEGQAVLGQRRKARTVRLHQNASRDARESHERLIADACTPADLAIDPDLNGLDIE